MLLLVEIFSAVGSVSPLASPTLPVQKAAPIPIIHASDIIKQFMMRYRKLTMNYGFTFIDVRTSVLRYKIVVSLINSGCLSAVSADI